MKTRLAAALAVSIATQADAAIVEFRGALCITTKTAACAADGWDVGDCFLFRYSPPNIGSNGAATRMSVLGQAFADNYELASGSLVESTLKAVKGVHVGRTGYGFTATARIATQVPKPKATSPQVSLTGAIAAFGDTAGCTIGFSASATRRP